MKYELNFLIEKGLVSDSIQLCKSIYFSNKGTSPSKEYNTVLKIHKLARRLESHINEVQFDSQNSFEEMHLIELFDNKYDLKTRNNSEDLLTELVDQLRGLRSNLQRFVSNTDEMLFRVEKFMGKEKINESIRPELVIDILSELYSIVENKIPTIGDSTHRSEFEQFAEIACLKIGFKEKVRVYANKLAIKNWSNHGLIKELIIPNLVS